MIHYFVTERQTGSMQAFLQSWGQRLAHRIKIVTYEALLDGRGGLPERGGAYIFTNLGHVNSLPPPARTTICDLHDRLVETRGAAKVLNDPARSLRRYDMLRRLHEQGINSFNAYRADDPAVRPRFPALLRHEMRSLYDQPALAHSPDQYAALIAGVRWFGHPLADFIVVEYCDTADAAGLYRKYGAFVVGDRIIPRHLYFSRDWHIRWEDVIDQATIEEELAFVHTNPHAETMLECAKLAGIGYGRFDYGLLDGRPQVWECNTNAGVIFPRSYDDDPERMPVHYKFVDMFAEAMVALDDEA
jgi:hypothetical protein